MHVSLWESDAHTQQMGSLKEMVVNARRDAEAVGVGFAPIVNYPVAWLDPAIHLVRDEDGPAGQARG